MPSKIYARDERAGPGSTSRTARRANATRREPSAPARTAADAMASGARPPGEGEEAKRLRHDRRKGWLMSEAHRQSGNRARAQKCEAFYDTEQWDYDEALEVKDRGQNPVAYNGIKTPIDWLIGMERRARIDYTVMSESDDEGADEDAANKTKLLKFLDETNLAHFERSWAAEDAFKAGVGWIEVGVRGAKDEPPVYCGAVPWREILWDSHSRKRDLSDARFIFRLKVVDLDVAEAIFTDKVQQLREAAQTGDNAEVLSDALGGVLMTLEANPAGDDPLSDYAPAPNDLYNTRKRVLLIECWSREPVRREPSADGLSDPVTLAVHVAIMTEKDTLIEAESPFKHNRFPFVPVWGYINRRTGLPYSPTWPLIGPQVSLNHRMSKSLFEASSNQVMIEGGAIGSAMTADEIRDELNAPDGMPVFADGALSGKRVVDRPNAGAAQQQLMLADRDIMFMLNMSGVNSDNRGQNSNVTSGKAVLAKQDQGSLLTAELFDNLLLARKLEGELTLSLAEQYIVEPMMVRNVGGVSNRERVMLNKPEDDGTFSNDITARKAKFVIGEQAWKQAYAEAAFEGISLMMTQLASAAPQVVINLLDLLFDMHPNLPKKAQIVARIRAVNGQTDPDGKMTPEQQAENAKKAERAEEEYKLQIALLRAELAETEAKGLKLNAATMLDKLTVLYEAAQAAQVLAQVPLAAPVADELARSVGFKDEDGDAPLDGAVPMPVAPRPPPPMPGGAEAPLPELQQADGALAGIETPAADGIQTQT